MPYQDNGWNHCVKTSKYGIFSGLYFPVFELNTGKYGPGKLRIWTFFVQWIWEGERIVPGFTKDDSLESHFILSQDENYS